MPAVEGEIERYFSQPCAEMPRALGRDGVPRPKPGVVDALLRIFGVRQDVHGNSEAKCAVFLAELSYCPLAALLKQLNDSCILHKPAPCQKGLSLI